MTSSANLENETGFTASMLAVIVLYEVMRESLLTGTIWDTYVKGGGASVDVFAVGRREAH